MKLQNLVIGFALFVAPAFAADIDGKWSGSMSTPGGDFPVSYTFKAEGATLTGTTTGPSGDIKIANGKIDGDKISFSVTVDFGGMPLTMDYKGVVAKDEINLSIDVFGMPIDLAVKRDAGAAANAAPSTPTAVASNGASAGAIDGNWEGTVGSPTGDLAVNLSFKSSGTALTGAVGPNGEAQITNGKIEGDKVSFTVSFDFGGMPLTMNYKGVLAKDEIKFVVEVNGMPVDLLVKRAK